MAIDADLQRLVKGIIKPWLSSTQEPPFSGAELLTIALTFAYYRKLTDEAIRPFWWDEDDRWTFKSTVASRKIKGEFGLLEVPATREVYGLWQVCIDEARVYLHDKFGYERKGQFRFLDLPTELRMAIYDMVFQYPEAGLFFELEGSEFLTKTKSLSAPFSGIEFAARPTWRNTVTYKQSMASSLSLLLVNKQIFEEALPCFYRLNLLVFRDALSAHQFLQGTAPYRRQYISHIAIPFKRSDLEYAPRLFVYLASLPKLRTLHIEINEGDWLRRYRPLRRGEIEILKIPGLEKLRKVKVEKVTFGGDCPRISEYLKAEMEGNAGKRKAVEVEGAVREQRSRAAKRGKKNYAK